jgi:hypothetical protein
MALAVVRSIGSSLTEDSGAAVEGTFESAFTTASGASISGLYWGSEGEGGDRAAESAFKSIPSKRLIF